MGPPAAAQVDVGEEAAVGRGRSQIMTEAPKASEGPEWGYNQPFLPRAWLLGLAPSQTDPEGSSEWGLTVGAPCTAVLHREPWAARPSDSHAMTHLSQSVGPLCVGGFEALSRGPCSPVPIFRGSPEHLSLTWSLPLPPVSSLRLQWKLPRAPF